jgi:hypothetical protein
VVSRRFGPISFARTFCATAPCGATPTLRPYALPDLSPEVYEEYLLAREVPERLAPSPGEPSLPPSARPVPWPSSPSL